MCYGKKKVAESSDMQSALATVLSIRSLERPKWCVCVCVGGVLTCGAALVLHHLWMRWALKSGAVLGDHAAVPAGPRFDTLSSYKNYTLVVPHAEKVLITFELSSSSTELLCPIHFFHMALQNFYSCWPCFGDFPCLMVTNLPDTANIRPTAN